MNCSTIISRTTGLRTITWMCNLFILLLLSCTKEEIIKSPDTNPTEIVLLQPESNTSDNLILTAEVRYLNNSDVVQSHGFLVAGPSGETSINKEYVMPTALTSGRLTLSVPDPEFYKEGVRYNYQYFVQTDKGIYRSAFGQFSVTNLRISNPDNLVASVGETITVDGEFTHIKDKYDLYYSYYTSAELKMSFEVINSGKSIRFTVPEGPIQGNNVTFRLVSKENTFPQLAAIVARAFIVAVLPTPTSYTYYYNDLVNLPYNVGGYNESSGLQVFIGNVFLNHSNYLTVDNFVLNQKGNSFPIGYTNGRDTITFPQPLTLIAPDPDAFTMVSEYAHPGTQFKITGPDPAKYNLYAYATVGNKTAHYAIDNSNANTGTLTIGDLPDGEYPLEINNNHFNYKSNKKIKVKKLSISSTNHSASYTGDIITLKGTFIKGLSYILNIAPGYSNEATCNTTGEIAFEIPMMKAGKQQIRTSYYDGMNWQRSYYSNTIPFEIKAAEINAVYPLRATAGTVITIEGNGMRGYSPKIADMEVEQIVHQNDKIQFKVPGNLPKGKYRVNINIFNFDMNNTVPAADYIEIY